MDYMEKRRSKANVGEHVHRAQILSVIQKDEFGSLESKRRRREQVYQAQKRHRQRNANKTNRLEAELEKLKLAAISAGLEENLVQIENCTLKNMLSAKQANVELADVPNEEAACTNHGHIPTSTSAAPISMRPNGNRLIKEQGSSALTECPDRYSSPTLESTCTTSIDSIASPTSWRHQLHTWSGQYFLPIRGPWPQWCHFVIDRSDRYSATAAALNAACLFMVAIKTGDDNLQFAGKTTQMKALQLLRRDLSLLDTSLRSVDLIDSIICTVQCLLTCDTFQGSGNTQATWMTHCHGIISILKSITTDEQITCCDVLDANSRSFTVWYGLFAKERVDIDHRKLQGPICRIAQRTAALSHAHKERKKPWSGVETMKTLIELDKVRKLVIEFAPNVFASWKALDPITSEFRDSRPGPAPWESSEEPRSIHEASDVAICAACMIYLRSMSFDLLEQSSSTTRAEFCQSQMVFVDTLRSAIGYMTGNDNGHVGMFYAVGPLWLAEHWYRRLAEQGPSQEAEWGLEWCKRRRDAFAENGVRCIPSDAFD